MWGGSDAVLLHAKEKAMAKVEVVRIIHTYRILRAGDVVPEIPEPVVNMHTHNGGVIVEHEETSIEALPLPDAPPLLVRILSELGAAS